MKEHAIPQDITGYKFHIVGNMTLKQFAEVAIGFVIAFFLYKTNLYAPVKWALVVLSASLGGALAFVPIEERPLDHWFITFFTILYKPTKFYWKRKPKIPDAFTYKNDLSLKKEEKKIDLSPQRRERISEYLQSVKTVQDIDPYDLHYSQRSKQLLSIFDDHSLKINSTRSEKLRQKPNLKVQVRPLIGVDEEENQNEQVEEINQVEKVKQSSSITPKPFLKEEEQNKKYDPITKKVLSIGETALNVAVPEIQQTRVEENYKKEQEKAKQDNLNIKQGKGQTDTTYLRTDNQTISEDLTSATVNKDLPFPTKPSIPNKLVGMTLTQNNDLIDDATLTLKDQTGKTITAVRSNALGQFFITSSLANGTYEIDIKKSGFSFSPLTISLEGKIVEPLEIRSNE